MPYLHLKLNFKNKITTKNKVRKKKKRQRLTMFLCFFFLPRAFANKQRKDSGDSVFVQFFAGVWFLRHLQMKFCILKISVQTKLSIEKWQYAFYKCKGLQ